MKKNLLLAIIGLLCLFSNAYTQSNVFNPNDPLITYDPANPPPTPPDNRIVKWVRSVRMTWNSDRFKAYYFNGMAFRLLKFSNLPTTQIEITSHRNPVAKPANTSLG